MTTYIDSTKLRNRFGDTEIDELIGADATEDPPVTGDADRLARACEDATSLINGYLSSRYALPLVDVPTMVEGWAADIARYRLWDDQAPEEVRRRYEDALAQLKQVSTGVISLPPDASGTPSAPSTQFGGYSATRVFTEDTLCGF